MAIETLSEDTTLYVRTTGNDTTGDGSSSTPYATVGRAIERIKEMWFGVYTLTIDVGEGTFNETEEITFRHPQGSQLFVNGIDEDLSSVSVNGIDTSLTYADPGETAGYYNVTLTLPVGKSVSVDDFIIIRSASGGTKPRLLLGCHRVTAWNSGTRVATVRVWVSPYDYYAVNSHPLPSGSITCGVTLSKTIIHWDVSYPGSDGITIVGPYSGGSWDHIVLRGYEHLGSGVTVEDGAFICLQSRCAVVAWDIGVLVRSNATVFADYAYFSRTNGHGIYVSDSSIANVRYAVFSAMTHYALKAVANSTISAQEASIINCSGESDPEGDEDQTGGIEAEMRSIIDAPSIEILYPTGWVLDVGSGSYINVPNITLTSDYDPSQYAYDTLVNGQSYINN